MNSVVKLPGLPSVGEIIRLYGLSARSQLSQNFLLDLNITDKIVKTAGNLQNSTVLEIGPGPGSLTRSLLMAGAKKVIAVEKDPRFIPALEILQQAVEDKLEVHTGDILDLDEMSILKNEANSEWNDDECNLKIIANLPFSIATPLLMKWLRQIPKRLGPFSLGRVMMILLFQAEVADRIVAHSPMKEYSRLSVMVGHLCSSSCCFSIPGNVFVPKTKVNAKVVKIYPLKFPRFGVSTNHLEYICRQIFGQRNKQLSNSTKALAGKGIETDALLRKAKLEPSMRPNRVSIEQWCDLANSYQEWLSKNRYMLDENLNVIHTDQ